ncbi:TPA: TfoX/Sxy family protein [Vibrio vulnificus]|uniref:TfoX/Sxy family protein n=1 Tax=Vibrio vulnificus TaxID=672 RepID=UPI001A1E979C|nr:competence-specific regulator [Vibrio vulnificus]HDY7466424.1 TfoX/Sxy family protein [Vibrio vulnificus]HDY8073212.1 TfoX/Sxy family protein [Vibrio vulnificus]
MSERIRDLQGLGPKSEQMLQSVGINTPQQLRDLGPIRAYLCVREAQPKASLNLLYALVGALEGEHWLQVAKQRRWELLAKLEGYQALIALFEQDQ